MSDVEKRTVFDRVCYAVRVLNYEMHLIQHGLVSLAERAPWRLLPVAALGLALAWICYWVVLVILGVGALLSFAARPIELRAGGRR